MRQPPNDFRDASRSTTEVAVSVRDVSLRYGEKFAVRDASFDLEKGKFLTILGPSGSGKTTLLRIVAGFVSPTEGEVLINGRSTVSVRPHKRSIGMVFQKLALFPHMTVAQNVAFPLKMRRFDARTIPDRVDKYLDLVRLGGFGGRRIHELSGGQQQRVAIARALVFEPDLLLLDEPLAALDRKLREEMQLEFRRIQRSLGVTTINVTHDQREALVVSDQIIVMDNARIQQKATPDITYRKPANSFVAGFIGVTNFLDGLVHSTDGELVRYAAGVQQLVGKWSGLSEPPQAGSQVTGALRAENVTIAEQSDDHRRFETIVEGTVLDAIYEGERVVYEIAVPAADGAVIRAYHHQSDARPVFGRGARLHLGWNAQDLMVFGD
jgi:putative spermidine/putrescine transport system ATP-binding protein